MPLDCIPLLNVDDLVVGFAQGKFFDGLELQG